MRETGFAEDWQALYTRHQHEKVVAESLTGKGFEVFLPLYEAPRRWKDRIKRLSLPLFPNYVFIRSGPAERAAVLATWGIYDFVRFGGLPAAIPIEQIEAVRRMARQGLKAEPHPYLRAGDRVRMRSGPLEGIEGILISKKNLFRLVLSVDLLVRSAAVEVDAADAERVLEGGRLERPCAAEGSMAIA
jgi:transcription antitermination factor NusG